jgi:hypothetical protein
MDVFDGKMHALEMEEEDEDETELFLNTRSSHGNGNGNGHLLRSPPTKVGTRTTGCSRKWLLAGSIFGFCFIAYRVHLSKSKMDASMLASQPPKAAPVPTSPSFETADEIAPTPSTTANPPVAMSYSKLSVIIPDPEHLPITQETKDAVTARFGKWHFWDGDEDNRPVADYCAAYANRDIPGDEFPDTSWQVDAVFVNHLLDDGEKLVERTMEAIYTEYGWGKPQSPTGLSKRLALFHWDKLDLSKTNEAPVKYSKRGNQGGGGWTTTRSFNGLVRRLLHAIMTNDTFTVVLGGHSAAAGHGNHFRQSYMHQFHKVLAPVFARLGVKLITRNLSQGGLGTIQNALGMGSLYGQEIDLLLWDSGMYSCVMVLLFVVLRIL